MRIDDLADRLLGDRLNFAVQRVGCRRLGVRVDHNDAVVGENNSSIAVDLVARRGDRRINAVGHGLQLEQLLTRSLRVGCESTARIQVVQGLDGRNCHSGAGQKFAACH
jgi:hypothetical protein